jgi:hypothetical protein
MKPRLRSEPLTKDDAYIFAHVWALFDGDELDAVIQNLSFEQDRRDADLMFWAKSRPGHSGCVQLSMGSHVWHNVLVRGKKPGYEWAVPDL